jgi:hypothetical protein
MCARIRAALISRITQESSVVPRVPVRRRTHWLGGLLAAALLLTATPALGAYPTPPVDGSAGKIGSHSLVDTVGTPGGTCTYGYAVDGIGYYNGLRRVRAGAPLAFARAGRTSQQVAWRLVVEAWDGTRWLPYDASPWQSRSATPSTEAAFSARSVPVDSYPHHGTYGHYRARIELRWYALNGTTVVGTARLFPGYYRSVEGEYPEWQQSGQCGGTTG